MFGRLTTRWRERRQTKAAATKLVHQVFEAMRQPEFYVSGGVPDTLTGRFDLSVLHAGLLLRVLSKRKGLEPLAQAVANEFFAEIDEAFRRMGVGDPAIPKRVRGSAEAFYGRLKAYDHAISQGSFDAIKAALVRNLYADKAPDAQALDAMAQHMLRVAGLVSGTSAEDFVRGEIRFPHFDGAQGS